MYPLYILNMNWKEVGADACTYAAYIVKDTCVDLAVVFDAALNRDSSLFHLRDSSLYRWYSKWNEAASEC